MCAAPRPRLLLHGFGTGLDFEIECRDRCVTVPFQMRARGTFLPLCLTYGYQSSASRGCLEASGAVRGAQGAC